MFNPTYIAVPVPWKPGQYQMIPIVGGIIALLDSKCWFGAN